MPRYHINPKTGRPNICRAQTPERCEYAKDGEAPPHYDSKEEARAGYEEQMSAQTVSTVSSDFSVDERLRNALFAISPEHRERWVELNHNPLSDISEEQKKLADKVIDLLALPVRPRGGRVTLLHPTEELLEDSNLSSVDLYKDGVSAVLEVYSRQGGGNDECYCEGDYGVHDVGCLSESNEEMRAHPDYIYDEYDSFDSTYVSMYFKITEEQAKSFEAIREAESVVESRKSVIQNVENLEVTPWVALGSDEDNREFVEVSKKIERLDHRRQEVERLVATGDALHAIEKFRDDLEAGKRNPDFDSLSRAVAEVDRSVEQHGRSYVSLDPQDSHKDIAEYRGKLERVESMVAEAEKLPQGSDLREHLIGSQRSALSLELESAKRGYDMTVSRTIRYLNDYVSIRSRNIERFAGKGAIAKARQEASEIDWDSERKSLINKLYAVGWVGKPEEIPSMPKGMFPSLKQ